MEFCGLHEFQKANCVHCERVSATERHGGGSMFLMTLEELPSQSVDTQSINLVFMEKEVNVRLMFTTSRVSDTWVRGRVDRIFSVFGCFFYLFFLYCFLKRRKNLKVVRHFDGLQFTPLITRCRLAHIFNLLIFNLL